MGGETFFVIHFLPCGLFFASLRVSAVEWALVFGCGLVALGQTPRTDSRTPDIGVFENVRFSQEVSRTAKCKRSRDPGK